MKTDDTKTPGNTNDGVGRLSKLSYRDGYIHDRDLEHHAQQENPSTGNKIRENNSAARRLLLGITITGILGLIVGSLFLVSTQQNQQPSQQTSGQTAPIPSNSQP